MKKIILVILLLLILPIVIAKQGHIKLLAVSETEEGYKGETADLYLEIKRGSGRVFLDTFPFTKLDTQMSTRFAKEIACNYLSINCDNFDFIYTIKADSAIIGGPSAGAAITVLTITVLDSLILKENVTITGTINSGSIIGPVGGVKEKIDAGASIGMNLILIPKGERFIAKDELNKKELLELLNITFGEEDNSSKNETIDLVEYGKEKGVKIIEVSTIDDALGLLTNKKIIEDQTKIEASSFYVDVMKSLAIQLCNRGKKLRENINRFDLSNESLTIFNEATNLTNKAKEAFTNQVYYTSASYCFGSNVNYKYLNLLLKNLSKEEILNAIYQSREIIQNFSDRLHKEDIKTLTDLESYIVVKERLLEAYDYLDKSWFALNNSKEALSNLAYGIERIYSAYAWNSFYGKKGKEFNFNQEIIKKSCFSKISEAEERYQYFTLFFPFELKDAQKEIKEAYSNIEKEDYKMCLFQASKAKSSVDSVLSAVGIQKDDIKGLLEQKLDVARKTINKQISKGIFPILGYSYYEYAKSLKDSDVYSALIYVEDALELSNLDMYFKEKRRIQLIEINITYIWVFLSGLFTGSLIMLFIRRDKSRKMKNPRKTLKKRIFLGKKR